MAVALHGTSLAGVTAKTAVMDSTTAHNQ